jgi:DNA-binding Xre family transcriptional regulator
MAALTLTENEEHLAEGWRIRYFCARKGWPLQKLAAEAKLTKSQVTMAITGQNITRKTCIKICRALGIDRWKLCKIDIHWRRIIPLVRKLEAKVKLQKRKERKEKGLRG